MSTMHDETKTIICKKCGCENSIQYKFCTNCGEKVIREDICSSCGAELNEGQKFCPECGSKTPKFIALEKVEAERKAQEKAEAERKAPKKVDAEGKISVAGIEMVRIPDNTTHKGLYFGKYQVTQAQWQAIMGNNPSEFTGDSSRPVEQVSWNDCQEFIKKLNARTEVKSAGIIFRLPTDEEWEYVCRAGSKGKYGLLADGREGTLDEMGWYNDNSRGKTQPVGQKKPNAWGLYDMHGNVWERTAPANGSCRFRRGGSYFDSASSCSSSCMCLGDPEDWDDGLGFRLAASRTVY